MGSLREGLVLPNIGDPENVVEVRYKRATTVRSALLESFQITRSAMNSIPVRAVLKGRPSMFRPETRSPTAVPAALIATTVSQ